MDYRGLQAAKLGRMDNGVNGCPILARIWHYDMMSNGMSDVK